MKENQKKNYMRAYIAFITRLSDENLEKEYKKEVEKFRKEVKRNERRNDYIKHQWLKK